MRRFVAPPPLAPGARIAVVAPGSPPRTRAAVEAGMDVLARWGYVPLPGPHLWSRAGDLAGSDAARGNDLDWALTAPGIDAVWAARGGWGTARLLERLDLAAAARRRRWLLGFSDLTALQAALWARGVCSWYAPVVAELADRRRAHAADLRAALADPLAPRTIALPRGATLVPGAAAGPLAGGCLAVLAALCGTRWQPRFAGAVVMLEDVGEAPYSVDRLLWQVRAAGVLDGIAGLAFAQFTACRPAPGCASRSLAAVLREHAVALGVPAVRGVPAGHGPRPCAMPLGYDAAWDRTGRALRLAPPGSNA